MFQFSNSRRGLPLLGSPDNGGLPIEQTFDVAPISSQTGFSLIETLIAIFIILVGLVGGLSLAVFSTATAAQVKERSQAYALAQEGLELVRNFRDSKWLEGEDIFSSISGPDFHYNDRYYQVDYTGLLQYVGSSDSNPDNFRLYYENGFYSHNTSGTATQYARSIHRLRQGNGERIISRVKWGDDKKVELEMHLYNWRDI